MRKILMLLVATTALTAANLLPVWSATYSPADGSTLPILAIFEGAAQAMPLILASDDDDRGSRNTSRHGHDDKDDDGDCDDDDDDDCLERARDRVPAGNVIPPQNGVFGNGAPPKGQMN